MYVAPSAVHGNGLFASTNIKRNQKILTLSGTWMKLDEFMRKYPNYEGEWNYDKHTNAVLFRENRSLYFLLTTANTRTFF